MLLPDNEWNQGWRIFTGDTIKRGKGPQQLIVPGRGGGGGGHKCLYRPVTWSLLSYGL